MATLHLNIPRIEIKSCHCYIIYYLFVILILFIYFTTIKIKYLFATGSRNIFIKNHKYKNSCKSNLNQSGLKIVGHRPRCYVPGEHRCYVPRGT